MTIAFGNNVWISKPEAVLTDRQTDDTEGASFASRKCTLMKDQIVTTLITIRDATKSRVPKTERVLSHLPACRQKIGCDAGTCRRQRNKPPLSNDTHYSPHRSLVSSTLTWIHCETMPYEIYSSSYEVPPAPVMAKLHTIRLKCSYDLEVRKLQSEQFSSSVVLQWTCTTAYGFTRSSRNEQAYYSHNAEIVRSTAVKFQYKCYKGKYRTLLHGAG
jgi:hypothetical protein